MKNVVKMIAIESRVLKQSFRTDFIFPITITLTIKPDVTSDDWQCILKIEHILTTYNIF